MEKDYNLYDANDIVDVLKRCANCAYCQRNEQDTCWVCEISGDEDEPEVIESEDLADCCESWKLPSLDTIADKTRYLRRYKKAYWVARDIGTGAANRLIGLKEKYPESTESVNKIKDEIWNEEDKVDAIIRGEDK